MKNIGQRIKSARESLGLTQEELANQIDLSLRTIQRIENGESIPRRKTLNVILGYLNIDDKDWESRTSNSQIFPSNVISKLITATLINFGLVLIVGFLTLDISANLNSRVGAFVLSIVAAILINQNTTQYPGITRMLTFGFGMILYGTTTIVMHGLQIAWVTNLLPCVIVFVFFLNLRLKGSQANFL